MKRIAIVTATRAEYGLLNPLIKRIESEESLEMCLLVTGTHLSDRYGYTIDEIRKDGLRICEEIPILEDGNSRYDISKTIANAIIGFGSFFANNHVDMVVLLGDRTELIGVACAAMNELIPIAHISGGSVTEGAIDDCVRHCLTKMSYIHFTTAEPYRKRVIQMGESPERVINAGSLAVENILNENLMTENEIREILGIPLLKNYAIVTFHPVTLDIDAGLNQVKELCEAMCCFDDLFYVITGSNADTGGNKINELFKRFVEDGDRGRYFESLGKRKYLSAIKYASFVLGNSSSGITEAPILGVPTVNIGDRQRGRLMASTVINSIPQKDNIVESIRKAQVVDHACTDIYGNGKTSSIIVDKIKDAFDRGITIKKGFYDLGRERMS